jgi:hypothetical protein
LQDVPADDRIELPITGYLCDVAFPELDVAQAGICTARLSAVYRTRVAFHRHDLSRWADQTRGEHRDVADSRPEIQNALARANARLAKERFGDGHETHGLSDEPLVLSIGIAEKIFRHELVVSSNSRGIKAFCDSKSFVLAAANDPMTNAPKPTYDVMDTVRSTVSPRMPITPGVGGGPRFVLRAEGLALLGLSAVLFWRGGYSWVLFAVLFLVPDISMVGYLLNPRVGAMCYNVVHTYVGPIVLGLIGVLTGVRTCIAISLIWTSHIGFDRLLGYGLKYATAFSDTHLGRIGRL